MKIHTLKTCDSCRKATKWMRENNFAFTEIPIRGQPPSIPELKRALCEVEGDIRKLFNTSGQDYRGLNLKEKLPNLSETKALALLASNGNLIKRPFLITKDAAIAGFNEDRWKKLLS